MAAFSSEEAARSVIIDMRGVPAIINQLPVECEEGQNIMTAVIEVCFQILQDRKEKYLTA